MEAPRPERVLAVQLFARAAGVDLLSVLAAGRR